MVNSKFRSVLAMAAHAYLVAAALLMGGLFGGGLEHVSARYHTGYLPRPPLSFETAWLLMTAALRSGGVYALVLTPALGGLWLLKRDRRALLGVVCPLLCLTAFAGFASFIIFLLFL